MSDFITENCLHGSQSYGIGRSIRLAGNDYRKFHWSLEANAAETPGGFLNPKDVCNFAKSTPRSSGRDMSCIMCGASDVSIPSQNKKVCKNCDSSFWLWLRYQVVFKFCKGCKNFCFIADFDDRPEGTKCTKCRQRSRDWYHSKKGGDENSSPTGSCEDLSPKSNFPIPSERFVRSASTSALPDDHTMNQEEALPPVPTLVSGDVIVAKRGQLVRKRSLSVLEDIATDGLRSVNHRVYKKLMFSPVASTPDSEGRGVYVTPGSKHQQSLKLPDTASSSMSQPSYFFPPMEHSMVSSTVSSASQMTAVPLFTTPYHASQKTTVASLTSTSATTSSSRSNRSISLSAFASAANNDPINHELRSGNLMTFPSFPLHQVTPEGYPILAPLSTTSSASGKKKTRKLTPVNETKSLLQPKSASSSLLESRNHFLVQLTPTDVYNLHKTMSNHRRTGLRKDEIEENEDDDAEVERLTSETFDRLVSAPKISANNIHNYHNNTMDLIHTNKYPAKSNAMGTEEDNLLLADAHSLLLSCRNASVRGLPPRLTFSSATSTLRTSPLATSETLSRPSTACSLTYSAANSPIQNENKENVGSNSECSSGVQSYSVSRTHSPFTQPTTLQTETSSVSTKEEYNTDKQAQSTAIVGIAISDNIIHNSNITEENDQLLSSNTKKEWQYDPKHNPLALLANFSDDLF